MHDHTTTLPDECDYCDQTLDEDEQLHPVYVGERPDPKPIEARATTAKRRDVVGYRKSAVDDVQVLGRPVDELTALIKALEGARGFEIEAKPSVMEVHEFGDLQPQMVDAPANDSKVGVKVTATPDPPSDTPDMMVCDYCKNELTDAQ